MYDIVDHNWTLTDAALGLVGLGPDRARPAELSDTDLEAVGGGIGKARRDNRRSNGSAGAGRCGASASGSDAGGSVGAAAGGC